MKNDKVSVIMPVYNSESFLQLSLESVLSQTYENIEIIAVDDGSTDSSTNILEKYLVYAESVPFGLKFPESPVGGDSKRCGDPQRVTLAPGGAVSAWRRACRLSFARIP